MRPPDVDDDDADAAATPADDEHEEQECCRQLRGDDATAQELLLCPARTHGISICSDVKRLRACALKRTGGGP